MSIDSISAWLTLHAAPGIGPATARQLLARFGSPEAILDATPQALRDARLDDAAVSALKAPDSQQLATALTWLEHPAHSLLTPDHACWPAVLTDISGAPSMLFAAGDLELLRIPGLAIVGSRNPTAGGVDNARAFAHHLAGHGLAIVSGLAAGIDAAAHEGALAANGATIAVLGTGIDITYPASNRVLQDRIAQDGLLLSEYWPGTQAHANHFPARNRIISALALGTLVVEATKRSGSLITARLAGEQGRSVFAIPGSIHNPMARGCHQLIRQGALLVEQADDIFSELGPSLTCNETVSNTQISQPPQRDPAYDQVLEALGWDPIPLDTLAERTGLTAAELSSMLLIMELEGAVSQVPGVGFVRRSAERTGG